MLFMSAPPPRVPDMFDSEFCPGKMMDAEVAAKYQESVRSWAWLS